MTGLSQSEQQPSYKKILRPDMGNVTWIRSTRQAVREVSVFRTLLSHISYVNNGQCLSFHKVTGTIK